MKPRFFATPEQFGAWLHQHHATAEELLVGFYKRATGRRSMTWAESVDQALCVGWIDGVRKRLDDVSYTIRFTPRRAGSIWSAINIRRVTALRRAGMMQPAGLAAFARRTAAKSRIYAYEQRYDVALEARYERMLQANTQAWAYFQELAPSYRYLCLYHVVSAKKEATRHRRIEKFIVAWAAGRRGF